MGLFYRRSWIGFALYAQDLWEESTQAALVDYHEKADRAAKEELRNARTDWLVANQAERSFPCGVVPDPASASGEAQRRQPRLNVLKVRPLQVIAAMLPSDVAFLREEWNPPSIVELGRIPRSVIEAVDVVDANDDHVPEPLRETLEPDRLAIVVLRWTNQGAPDEDRFAFRSAWMAWQAARQLRSARSGSGRSAVL
jgi:hypothetical protein